MSHRSKVQPKSDKKKFSNTAAKTKAINVKAKPMRGGTRL